MFFRHCLYGDGYVYMGFRPIFRLDRLGYGLFGGGERVALDGIGSILG